MPTIPVHNLSGLNLKISPFLQGEGQILRALNVERDNIGAFRKRSGYVTYLNAIDTTNVLSFSLAPLGFSL